MILRLWLSCFATPIAIVFCTFLVSCMPLTPKIGKMCGVITSTGEKVKIEYEVMSQSTFLNIIMPDTVLFKGRIVHASRVVNSGQSTQTRGGARLGLKNLNNLGAFLEGKDTTSHSEKTSGKMSGKLFSNDGQMMECDFQYADALGDPSDGGFGVCITNNTKVDISWRDIYWTVNKVALSRIHVI